MNGQHKPIAMFGILLHLFQLQLDFLGLKNMFGKCLSHYILHQGMMENLQFFHFWKLDQSSWTWFGPIFPHLFEDGMPGISGILLSKIVKSRLKQE